MVSAERGDRGDTSSTIDVDARGRHTSIREQLSPLSPLRQSSANEWTLYFAHGEPMTVGFAPAATAREVFERYPDALSAVETASRIPSCQQCRHATRFGNCGEPVAAGLTQRFGLVAHPDHGAGCEAFDGR